MVIHGTVKFDKHWSKRAWEVWHQHLVCLPPPWASDTFWKIRNWGRQQRSYHDSGQCWPWPCYNPGTGQEKPLITERAFSAGAAEDTRGSRHESQTLTDTCIHAKCGSSHCLSGCRLCNLDSPTQLPRKLTLMGFYGPEEWERRHREICLTWKQLQTHVPVGYSKTMTLFCSVICAVFSQPQRKAPPPPPPHSHHTHEAERGFANRRRGSLTPPAFLQEPD